MDGDPFSGLAELQLQRYTEQAGDGPSELIDRQGYQGLLQSAEQVLGNPGSVDPEAEKEKLQQVLQWMVSDLGAGSPEVFLQMISGFDRQTRNEGRPLLDRMWLMMHRSKAQRHLKAFLNG